jgi:mannosyl-3-phosphoglycerate phosphatase
MNRSLSLLIFTDLDGTLLDQHTYSFESALPALHTLKEKKIPVILCTSKTRTEIEKVRLELNNAHPFISENGGALFIPKDYFVHPFSFTREDSQYFIIDLGTPYDKIRDIFDLIKSRFPKKIKGFGDLSTRKVADLCGFSLQQAGRAKMREYDEPFVIDDEFAASTIDTIKEIARQSNLRITKGGRFYHLTGNNDKGKAVILLRDLYGEKSKQLKTIALGDSQNDYPMLQVVDYPVLVQKPNGSYDPSIQLDNLIFAPGTGPSGWGCAVFNLLNTLL